ncbi:ROK family transcriptional regulator [Glycomyces harbinensis]|uniref:ROK family transcriptional regulator n=1 Tax=Glycomyces harbinensis TaxID=58114 RepID=UPI000B857A74|nr:ROK family transcriptional regulator [Glycomyces harbinensis]
MRSFGSGTRVPTLAAVLDIIRERTTVSRVELAEATGLTQATMTRAVRKLLAMGFVHEVGTARSNGGKPRRLLELQPEAHYQVGIQFDRFASVGVVVDLAGRIVARREMPGPGERRPREVLAEFAETVRSMLDAASIDRSNVLGIGLATHGPQDREAGVLLTPQPTPEWLRFPVAATLADLTGLPVVIENDATAAGIGLQARGDSASSFAVVFMSGGIGSGLIIDGHPYRGSTSNGLELGHISVDATGPRCDCGNRGCVDNVASPTAIARQAAANPELVARLGLGRDPLSDFSSVGRAAIAGDPDAAALILLSAQRLSIATVSLVNLFDIGRVVLAGSAFAETGAVYRDAVQQVLDESVFMRHVHGTRVELADNLTEAAAIGGAVVVLRNRLESPTVGDWAAI